MVKKEPVGGDGVAEGARLETHMWLIRVEKSREGFRVSQDMSLLVQP